MSKERKPKRWILADRIGDADSDWWDLFRSYDEGSTEDTAMARYEVERDILDGKPADIGGNG